MDAELIVVGGKTNKRSIKLKLPMVIGRSRHARLTIAHPMISRRHSELFERDGLLMVRDLDSLNGTVVDGQRVKEAPLPPEAEFSIGPLTFRAQYQYEGDLGKLPATVPDPKGTAVSPSPTNGAELPDFEALIEEEIMETELAPPPKEQPPSKAAAVTPATTAVRPTPAAGVKKPAEKAAAEKKTAPKTVNAVEEPAPKSAVGEKPAGKSSTDPFDDLLNEFN
jgi:hypothetical protein